MLRSIRSLLRSEKKDRCGSASTVQSMRATAGGDARWLESGSWESPCLTGVVKAASDEGKSTGGF